jgi:hypothetical protein
MSLIRHGNDGMELSLIGDYRRILYKSPCGYPVLCQWIIIRCAVDSNELHNPKVPRTPKMPRIQTLTWSR